LNLSGELSGFTVLINHRGYLGCQAVAQVVVGNQPLNAPILIGFRKNSNQGFSGGELRNIVIAQRKLVCDMHRFEFEIVDPGIG